MNIGLGIVRIYGTICAGCARALHITFAQKTSTKNTSRIQGKVIHNIHRHHHKQRQNAIKHTLAKMKASTFLVVTSSCLLGCGVESFSLSPERAVSRREVSKAIISGGASCLIAGTTVPLPALAEEGEYITTDRGIKYKVVKEADPSSPTPVRGQKVKAIYTLYLNGFPEDTAQAKKVHTTLKIRMMNIICTH